MLGKLIAYATAGFIGAACWQYALDATAKWYKSNKEEIETTYEVTKKKIRGITLTPEDRLRTLDSCIGEFETALADNADGMHAGRYNNVLEKSSRRARNLLEKIESYRRKENAQKSEPPVLLYQRKQH